MRNKIFYTVVPETLFFPYPKIIYKTMHPEICSRSLFYTTVIMIVLYIQGFRFTWLSSSAISAIHKYTNYLQYLQKNEKES